MCLSRIRYTENNINENITNKAVKRTHQPKTFFIPLLYKFHEDVRTQNNTYRYGCILRIGRTA